jgi:Domain of unknown function (DUF6933)
MVTLRCTQKLLKRLRLKPLNETPVATSRLGDWYAAPFSVGHDRLVLCVNETALLPAFIRSQSQVGMIARFREAVLAVLQGLGVPDSVLENESRHLAEVAIGTTASRTVLGSMNDFAVQAYWHIKAKGSCDLVGLALALSESPCSPLRYRQPGQVARELLVAV